MTIVEGIACTCLIIGFLFSLLGVIGILRLPDTYTRLHASGKTGTIGIFFLCVGAAILMPFSTPKLVALGIFIVFSGPVASHAIAAAVFRCFIGKGADDIETLPVAETANNTLIT